MDRGWLERFLEHRIADRGVLRLIAGRRHAVGLPRRGWFADGEEQRSARAAGSVGEPQQPWEQVGGAGVPVHPFDVGAFGADGCSAVWEVELLDVEHKDLRGAGGGLVQHSPQRSLSRTGVFAARELAVDRSLGQVAGVVGVLGAALADAAKRVPGRVDRVLLESFSPRACRRLGEGDAQGVGARALAVRRGFSELFWRPAWTRTRSWSNGSRRPCPGQVAFAPG